LPQILVIDDDPGLLNVCSVGLQALGHTVRTAETGQEGISQAALQAPDVIVLDLGLPDLDGMVVCNRIRTWSEVPIIVLSADGSEDRKVDALDHGADDYMTKPFGMRELHARVQVALRHHRPGGGEECPAQLAVGALHLDLVHREATFDGRPLDQSPFNLAGISLTSIKAGQRIGITRGRETFWRFWLAGSPFVSRPVPASRKAKTPR